MRLVETGGRTGAFNATHEIHAGPSPASGSRQLLKDRNHVSPSAHILGLLLYPKKLFQVGKLVVQLHQLWPGKGVELLDPRHGDLRIGRRPMRLGKVEVDLATAEQESLHLLCIGVQVEEDALEASGRQLFEA